MTRRSMRVSSAAGRKAWAVRQRLAAAREEARAEGLDATVSRETNPAPAPLSPPATVAEADAGASRGAGIRHSLKPANRRNGGRAA